MKPKGPTLPPKGKTVKPSPPPPLPPHYGTATNHNVAKAKEAVERVRKEPTLSEQIQADLVWVVQYQPPTALIATVTTRFPGDYNGAIELRDGKLDEGLWVRCFIERSE